MKTLNLEVRGMTCASCAVNVSAHLKKRKGVFQADVNFAAAKVRLAFDEEATNTGDLAAWLRQIGYELVITDIPSKSYSYFPLLLAIVLGLPVMILGMAFHHEAWSHWVQFGLSLPVILISGFSFYQNAFKRIRFGQSNMDTLITIGVWAAFLLSTYQLLLGNPHQGLHFESAVMILAFVLLGKAMEHQAIQRANRALAHLREQKQQQYLLVEGEKTISISASAIEVGHTLRLLPGDQIPADGRLQGNEGYVNEQFLSGESKALLKKQGEMVYGGSLVMDSPIELLVEKIGTDTLMAGIIQSIEEANGKKFPIQALADRISKIFVPVVLFLAASCTLLWAYIPEVVEWERALVYGLTLLVVACPCALGLATPVALAAASSKAYEAGILIRKADVFEALNNINIIAFDKTGTLSLGRPQVKTWHQLTENESAPALESKVLALARNSNHPLSKGLSAYLSLKNPLLTEAPSGQFLNFSGKGIMGKFGEETWRLGSLEWMHEKGIPISIKWTKNSQETSSIVCISRNDTLVFYICLEDELRPEAAEVISELKAEGFRILLLSGDKEVAVRASAHALKIDECYGGLRPNDKIQKIASLQEEGKVLMIGDGINDGPALAKADAGMSFGKASDLAMQQAGMVILKEDLHLVGYSIRLAKKTRSIIGQNFIWAFGYNLLALPLAGGALHFIGWDMPMEMAGALMALSSVSVVGNSLRLLMDRESLDVRL